MNEWTTPDPLGTHRLMVEDGRVVCSYQSRTGFVADGHKTVSYDAFLRGDLDELIEKTFGNDVLAAARQLVECNAALPPNSATLLHD